MQHLTFLRMQRASNLLATTDEKIEAIAHEVGWIPLPRLSLKTLKINAVFLGIL